MIAYGSHSRCNLTKLLSIKYLKYHLLQKQWVKNKTYHGMKDRFPSGKGAAVGGRLPVALERPFAREDVVHPGEASGIPDHRIPCVGPTVGATRASGTARGVGAGFDDHVDVVAVDDRSRVVR